MSFDIDLTPMLTTASVFVAALFSAFAVVIGLKLAVRIVKYIMEEIVSAF